MTLGSWTQAHRRSILFLLAMLALAGLAAAFRLPVSLFPTVDFPRVVVSIDAGDQPAEQMEMLVTRPVEEAVRRVPGVRNVRSTTSRGSAEVSINFDWGRDMAAATLQVNAAIAQVQGTLPPAAQVLVRRMDPTVFPIIAYSLVSPTLSPVRLHDLAEYRLRPALSSVDGVARVQVQGGAVEEYRVTVDPARLAAVGLGLDDVAKAVPAAAAFRNGGLSLCTSRCTRLSDSSSMSKSTAPRSTTPLVSSRFVSHDSWSAASWLRLADRPFTLASPRMRARAHAASRSANLSASPRKASPPSAPASTASAPSSAS